MLMAFRVLTGAGIPIDEIRFPRRPRIHMSARPLEHHVQEQDFVGSAIYR